MVCRYPAILFDLDGVVVSWSKQCFVPASLKSGTDQGLPDEPELLLGVSRVFSILRKLEIPHMIVSNAPRDHVLRQLSRFDFEWLGYLCREDFQYPKPSPQPYLFAAKRLGVAYREWPNILVIEDSPAGVLSGVRAGMKVVGVCNTHSESQLLDAGALTAIDLITQILTLGL